VTTIRRTALLVALTLLTTACTAEPAPAPDTEPTACTPEVLQDELPLWARGGFTGVTRMPHTMGRSGRIVAILFGYPLHQPPAEGRNNKILWVASPASGHEGADPDLTITARLNGTGDPVERKVGGGPGPSIVDLPQAGCWRLALTWGGRTDAMDLEYTAP
jgi:hypothetical protein